MPKPNPILALARASAQAVPDEHTEQVWLFQWAAIASASRPELADLFAIANGGHRHKATAGKLKAEGVKPGVPDICLPHPRADWCSLWIELKRQNASPSDVSPAQRAWHERLRAAGHRVEVCKGFEAARVVLLDYLALPARRSESAA